MSPRERLGARLHARASRPKKRSTELSGRGVGMDIVKTNIAASSAASSTSRARSGSARRSRSPCRSRSRSSACSSWKSRGRTFCMPLASVEEAIVLDESLVRVVEGREVMTHARGDAAALPALAPLRARAARTSGARKSFVVIAAGGQSPARVRRRSAGRAAGHRHQGARQSLKNVRGFAGATELGDQRVGLVLDAAALIEEVLAGHRRPRTWRTRRGIAVALLTRRGTEPRAAMRRAGELGSGPSTWRSCWRSDLYAVPIALIAEILKPPPITEVPRAPREVMGVISVRGRLVTVLDLRRRFRLARGPLDAQDRASCSSRRRRRSRSGSSSTRCCRCTASPTTRSSRRACSAASSRRTSRGSGGRRARS